MLYHVAVLKLDLVERKSKGLINIFTVWYCATCYHLSFFSVIKGGEVDNNISNQYNMKMCAQNEIGLGG